MSALLALFARSLREECRDRIPYAARAGLALILMFVLFFAGMASAWQGAPGLALFEKIAWLQTVFITLAGLSYFASAITEEKEEEMLGLLRLTNLNPLSILLGKSTSRLCGALLLLAAQLPFTLLAVTLGGVSLRQILAVYCTLGAYTFFLCNLALLASVLARRTTWAALLTAAALVAMHLGAAFSSASPFTRLDEIFATGFHAPPLGWQVASNLAAGLVFFALAWGLFDHFCSGEKGRARIPSAVARKVRHRWLQSGRVETYRAIRWKDFHFIHGGKFAFAAKLAGYPLALIAWWKIEWPDYDLSDDFLGTGLAVASMMTLALAVEIAIVASRMFRHEIRDRTFSALTLLPIPLAPLVREKLLAVYRSLAPAALFLTLGLIVALSAGLARGEISAVFGAGMIGGYAALIGASCIAVFAHVIALTSLHAKSGLLAVGFCVLTVISSAIFMGMTCGLGVFFLPFIAFAVVVELRKKILARLEELSGEA